ncbi:MAG: hypothetical protein Unbinned4585contig1001_7 [Prokaryotic dsDNA virus sp.]|nr:MAG: hypothetical protein Unbinned4585contig1001_7 [Prokaryotic dsDNA virus sp.]|tara:strand:+ start:1803 stop:2159 length:357 start_codon:yes stop_codon:yes gene_type:complete
MKPIYLNKNHEVIIETYLNAVYDSINELVIDKSKYSDFKDICNVIIEYHNEYSNDKYPGNYHDFLMIIPTNFSTMVAGFLCGLETKDNAAMIRLHRHVLGSYSMKVMEDLRNIQPINE